MKAANHAPVGLDTLSAVWLVDGELVGSKRTSLVRAEHIYTSQSLDGSELLYDGHSLSEEGSSDSEGGCGNTRKTDGYTDDEEDERVGEQVVILGRRDIDVSEETTNPDTEEEDDDKDEQSSTDGAHDKL